uniref:Chitin-binding type-2 domain-containing protein n=1 Tax=Setaria digitata TaxID=48799 RepID=A0A915Q686_9BILA
MLRYVGCRELIKDIIYCENGFIYDTKLGSCRNRNWRTVSLGDCNRHFIYCRGQVPQQFVCAEGFIFSKGRCVPIYQSSDDQCWECQDGDKRHTSLHSCSEYSICEKDHWEDRRCPLGMIFSEIEKMCQVDPSCAHPAKCKMGTSYHLRCNEYLICSWKGIFEHRFCPPFYRWDNRNVACIPDSSCLPFTKVPCRENEIVSSFDCKFYHQCSDGEWHRKPCPIHPTVICGACYHSRTITWEREMHCMNGDTVANSQDCQSYAICDGGKWKSARCKFGLFWNENLQRCDYINQCSAVKRAACNHRQRLAGLLCNEYIECIQGSWILMKCLPGYAFDRKTKKCTFSNDYVIPDNDYLNVIEDDIADLLPIFESERKVEQNPRRHCQFGNKIRNEYDCKRYFECEENKYRERYCEDNDEFNDENGRCEKDYRCNLSQCRNGRMIENEICGHYQICINGKWQKGVCEGSRQFANGHCQLTYCNDDNDEISSLSTSCEEGNVLADDIDCKRYFICRNGRFQEQFCWNGTSFDKKHRYCARSTNCMPTSGCIEADVKANGEDHSTYQICKDGKFELRPCPYGLIYNPSKRTCEKGSSSTADTKYETCEESGDAVGYRADPIDCRKFYQCAHGKWVSKTCPAKLYWNMEKTTCDWPYNVESCK